MNRKTKTEIYQTFSNVLENVYCGWSLAEDSGWNGLLWKLLTELDMLEAEKGATEPRLAVAQVKEKFGGLRFYVDGPNKKQRVNIQAAEQASYWICQHCGTSHNVETKAHHGWLLTLCESCRLVREKQRSAWIEAAIEKATKE